MDEITINITEAVEEISVFLSDPDSIPRGGVAGQILAKSSSDDYATVWIDPPDTQVTWAGITGDINQAEDLIELVNTKAPTANPVFTNSFTVNASGGSLTYASSGLMNIAGTMYIGKLGAADSFIQGVGTNFSIYAHASSSVTTFKTDGTIDMNTAGFNVTGRTIIKGSNIASDYMLRVDTVGARIGPVSTSGNVNTNLFQVGAEFSNQPGMSFDGSSLYLNGSGVSNIVLGYFTGATISASLGGITTIGGAGGGVRIMNAGLNNSAAQFLVGESFINGRIMVGGYDSPAAMLHVNKGNATYAQFRLEIQDIPKTSPQNGDGWFDGSDIFIMVGGVLKKFNLINA